MNDKSEENNCDRMLDQALADYSRVEVPLGLETRILRRIRRPQRLQMPGRTLGGIAALADSALLLLHQPKHPPVVQPQLLWSRLLIPMKIPALSLQIGRVTSKRNNIPRSKAEVFPTPTSLTSEEQALLTMAQNFPKETAEAFAESRNTIDKPIHIEAVVIKPLAIEGENQ